MEKKKNILLPPLIKIERMKKFLLFTISLFICQLISYAQLSFPGEPYSYAHKGISLNVATLNMPYIDNQKLLAEDEATKDKGMPLRVAVLQTINITMDNAGRWDIMPNGDRLWRVGVKSEGALALSFMFDKFDIPEGGEVYMYSPDQKYIIGMFDSRSTLENGEFYTQEVPGDELVLEYYEPANVDRKGEIIIKSVEHTYRGMSSLKGYHGTAEGDCHINTICPDADDWRDQVNAVVCIKLTAGENTYLCSGAMINNTRQDNTPYVFTAEHCFENNASWRYYFNYETNTCDLNYGGVYNRVAIGGTYRAKDNRTTSSDFMLMEITGAINDAYKETIYFAGWDRSTTNPGIGVCIHHPGGDYKKISFPRLVVNGGTYYNKFWGVSWILGANNKGVTEGGSSGSPLFGINKKIVGSLCCGTSSCVANTAEGLEGPAGYDYYGKFSNSWENNANVNPAKKLQPWLDPDNYGHVSLNGKYWNQTVDINEYAAIEETFAISPNPSNGMVTISGNFAADHAVCNVYDILGKVISSNSMELNSNMTMNFSNLTKGVYIVEFVSENHIYRTKMVIAK